MREKMRSAARAAWAVFLLVAAGADLTGCEGTGRPRDGYHDIHRDMGLIRELSRSGRR